MISLRFSIEFTNLLRNFSNKNRYCIGVLRFCRKDPKKICGLAVGPLASLQNRGAAAAEFPASSLASGEGPVGEKEEGVEAHPWVVLGREEVLGGGGSMEQGGWRRLCLAVAALRRREEGVAYLRSFVGRWGCRSRA